MRRLILLSFLLLIVIIIVIISSIFIIIIVTISTFMWITVLQWSFYREIFKRLLHEKYPNIKFFLVSIFPYKDWVRRDTPYLRIQYQCGKIWTRKNSVFGHFSHSG